MSEVLASLKKRGGGDSIDMLSPDVEYANGSMANNATASIAVTQLPKYILFIIDSGVGTSFAIFGIVDAKNNVANRCGYYGNSIRQWVAWPTYSDYIPSITSSSVTVKNSSGVNARMVLEIYY